MGHDDLILRNLETDQVLGEVNSRSDRGVFPKKKPLWGDSNNLTTHGHSQDVRELVCFSLPEAIPCVRDKNNRHRKLSLRVDQLLKRLFRGGDRHPSSHEHAINVEQQPKARLRLQEGKMNEQVRRAINHKA